jgi:hypothetical protein
MVTTASLMVSSPFPDGFVHHKKKLQCMLEVFKNQLISKEKSIEFLTLQYLVALYVSWSPMLLHLG